MFRKRIPKILIPLILLLILTIGCEDRATRIAREASDRQAQQNTAMAELNKEVASGTHQLVAADAQARREIVGVHHELQAERTRLDTGWDALEQERQHIAAQRRTESILVPAVEVFGVLALVIVLLSFCWYALVASRHGDDSATRLNEILICEVLADESPLISHSERGPDMPGQSQLEDRPGK